MASGRASKRPRWTGRGLLWDLWLLRRRLERRTTAIGNGRGLSPAGIEVIVELVRAGGLRPVEVDQFGIPTGPERREGLSQRELADRLRVRPPTISSTVTTLVRLGVVERVPADDGRAWSVRLLPVEAIVVLLEGLAMVEDDLAGQFKKPELDQLRALVGKLSARLKPLDEPPDEP